MKVASAASTPQTPGKLFAVARSGKSFAELLADGRSVQSIRGERAFGFSETGILGATRALPATAETFAVRGPVGRELRPPVSELQPTSQRTAVGETQVAGGKEPAVKASSPTSPGTLLANAIAKLQPPGAVFRSGAFFVGECNSFPVRSVAASAMPSRHRRRQMSTSPTLTLTEDDTGLHVVVSAAHGLEIENASLVGIFQEAAFRFSVTFRDVTIDKVKYDSLAVNSFRRS